MKEVLDELRIVPDFRCSQPDPGDTVVWIHRRTADADIYFVGNQQPWPVDVVAQFRVTGREAELWHPDTGDTEPAEYNIGSSTTSVPLHLDPRGSVFVIFRTRAVKRTRVILAFRERLLATLDGSWRLTFPPDWGAPIHARFDSLFSWTQSTDSGIRYFSGTALYTKKFNLPTSSIGQGKRIVLDLGQVKEIAEVSVNGQSLGIYWKPPFRLDITRAVKQGENRLDVRVTNLWPNRLIGDEQPGAKRYIFSIIRPFKKDTRLLESGLMGPVNIFVR